MHTYGQFAFGIWLRAWKQRNPRTPPLDSAAEWGAFLTLYGYNPHQT